MHYQQIQRPDFKRLASGAVEMAELAKCLLYKHGNLSSGSQAQKSRGKQKAPVISVPERQIGRSLEFTGQPA